MRKIVTLEDKIFIDDGIFFGKGVFETILFKDRGIFLNFHIERLKKGLEILNLPNLKEEEELLRYIQSLNLKNKGLKIVVTEKNIIVSVREIPYKEDLYKKGWRLKVGDLLRNTTSILTKIKSINYIENIMEKNKANKEGYDDVIFLNEKGYISETSVANIFFIKNNNIYTPKSSNGLLEGTVRNWLINRYNVIECNITLDELKDMDEVFITNSLIGIMKVNSIGEIIFNKGDLTEKIRKVYAEAITRDEDGGF